MSARTLIELMAQNRQADRHITYHSAENTSRRVCYGELHSRALGVLRHLQSIGAKPGDKLILLLNNNEQFIDAFWGAVLGGIIPVPVAIGISDEHRHKLLRIAHRLGNPFIYTDRKALERIGQFAEASADASLAADYAKLRQRAQLVEDLSDLSLPGTPHNAEPQDTAFIQFSSGSTSEPKGVVLTHANLMAHNASVTQVAHFNSDDVSLSWMPLTHDMGLIGFHLVMFANRVHMHLMPTDLFVRRPLLWLSIATQVRATIICSPNFGYRHYVKVLGDRSPTALQLDSVRLIFNGAEPISVELCEEFLAHLAASGLKREAMYPVYGLAEATLAACFPPVGRPMKTLLVNRHSLGVGDRAEIVSTASRDSLALVSVGAPIPDCHLRIVDNQDGTLPDGQIGHILLRGTNITAGYFEDPATNAASITADGWLRTGDLGLQFAGETYITGRAKEILFVNGQNYYPHDLEAIAQRAPDMELGKVVVAGVRPPGAETDQLTVFALYRGDLAAFPTLANHISRLINEQAGLEVERVVPVKRIPKTTSGKIQRHLLEEQFLNGEFATEMAELDTLTNASSATPPAAIGSVESKLLAICNAILAPRHITSADNLFEIGASSLKLIEIHEQIDQEYPNLLDLTELFDHPTIGALATHLSSKLDQGP